MFDARGVEFLLRDPSSATYVASRHPDEGATVVVRDGRAVTHGGAFDPGPFVAVQGYPWILRAGVVHASAQVDAETVGRVALATLDGGERVGIAVAVAPMLAFANDLRALDALDAVYLDGGGSTYVRTAGRTHGDGRRALPSFVFLRGADHSPTRASTGSAGAGEILVALLALRALQRRRRRR